MTYILAVQVHALCYDNLRYQMAQLYVLQCIMYMVPVPGYVCLEQLGRKVPIKISAGAAREGEPKPRRETLRHWQRTRC